MNFNSIFEELDKLYQDDVNVEEELAEAADDDIVDDIVDDDEPAVEELAEDEPKQFVIECTKCAALGIKDEADIVNDEESGLVNIEEACPFCEEAAGCKIIGVMVPYEADEAEAVNEDVADWVRNKLNKPASTKTQQRWEDELNDDSISPERRKQLEKKFLQNLEIEKRNAEANK